MKLCEKNIEKSAWKALLECLSKISFLKVIQHHEASDEKDLPRFGIKAKITLKNKVFDLIAEIKSSGQPRFAREAVNQMLRYKDKFPNAYFVFIAPYITSKAAEICESEGVGYLDLSGNCLFAFKNIYIHKTDYPNRFKEKRDLKSLFTAKAERILRVLFCHPGKKWKIKELALESGVSLGQAFNVKKKLYDRELISGKRGGFRLRDPATLLRDWGQSYDYRKNQVKEFFSLKSVTDIENTLAAYCNSKKIKYALTGLSGAARIEPAVNYNKAIAYAAELSEDLLSALSLKAVESDGNLLLFTPYDEGVLYGSSKVNEIQIASEIQLYLDLQGFRWRGEEAAASLFERIVAKAW